MGGIGDELEIDSGNLEETVILNDKTKHRMIPLVASLDESKRELVKKAGALSYGKRKAAP